QEALYALSAKLPPVNQFFVDPALRGDAELEARLAAPANPNTGVFHNQNEPGSRGGFSLYVPEYYAPDRAWPLVMALHGGSGSWRGWPGRTGCAACPLTSCMAGSTGWFRCRWRGRPARRSRRRAPTSPIASSTISATPNRAR